MQHASTLMTFPMEECPQPVHKTKNPKNSVISLKDILIWAVKFCKLEKTFRLTNQNLKGLWSLEMLHLDQCTILNILLYTMYKA